jgi:hypothetical protein
MKKSAGLFRTGAVKPMLCGYYFAGVLALSAWLEEAGVALLLAAVDFLL